MIVRPMSPEEMLAEQAVLERRWGTDESGIELDEHGLPVVQPEPSDPDDDA